MPAMDKTGPFGTGPHGRGMGPCQQGNASPQDKKWSGRNGWGRGQSQGQGRGGRGFGRGRGRCCGGGGGEFETGPLSPKEEADLLEEQIATMQERLNALKANDTPSK